MTDANSLGTYLKDRRAKLDPAAFGFPLTRRRTPGLRREEVAHFSGLPAYTEGGVVTPASLLIDRWQAGRSRSTAILALCIKQEAEIKADTFTQSRMISSRSPSKNVQQSVQRFVQHNPLLALQVI